MSFNKMKIDELRQVAESFGVDVPAKASKESILIELSESGVEYSHYEDMKNIKDASDAAKDEDDLTKNKKMVNNPLPEADEQFFAPKQLLRMIGRNASLQVLGFTFTQSRPFQAMTRKEAQEIIDFYPDRFRIASPREADQFYS